MKYTLLLVAAASYVHTQEPLPYNPNYPQPENQNGTLYRPNTQVPYGSFPVNANDFNTPQSSFYQNNFNSDTYGEGDNEVDTQSTASYYAGLDYEERNRCPPNWIRFRESCYRFTKSPSRPRNEARKICLAFEADLAAVNNPEEHGFIITNLMRLDPQKSSWYVGAHQQTPNNWVNEGDGTQLTGLENAFFEDHQLTYTSYNLLPQDYLVYRFSQKESRWGLMPVDGTHYFHFICEGQSQRLRYLIEEERSFTYGLDTFDPERIPRGPYFIKEPEDTIYDPQRNHYVQLVCIASGYPAPVYKWYREDYQVDSPIYTEIDPLADTRFIISGGTLMIYNPDADKDNARYHCTAANKFGVIRSESVRLSYGFIREFNQKRPTEIGNQYWGKVIYCDPPSYYPSVNFLWARDYFPTLVEEDKRVFVSYDGGLYFSALETIDRGNYSCNVMSKQSGVGRNGPFFSLSVYPHSDYQQLKFPNNFPKLFPEAPIVGQEVRLECVSFGYPVPSYNWTRRHGSLPRHAQLSNFDRVLTIPSVAVDDEGEYICDVHNDRARISNSVFLKVQAEPNFTIPLSNKHVDNKGELHWNCEAFGIPDVNYTWWKNGKVLSMDKLEPEDRDRYIIQDNVLTIKFLDPTRDPGMYQCEAKNQLKARYSTGQLRVLSLKPSFKKRPLESETYGSDGGNVTLRCNPEAAPKPTFTWKKDGVVIGGGGKRFINDGTLVIRQLSRDDEGVYTCVAKNQYGTDESRGRLIVLRAPRFTERLPQRITTQVGENIFLHCNADIDPILDTAYLWNHNGIRMKEAADLYADKRIIIDGSELTILNVSLSDVGDYECVVKSAIGRISSHTQIRVEGPPGPPGGLQILNIQRSSVTFEWTDSNSNGRPITSYVVTGRTHWNSTWVTISDNVVNVMEIDRYNQRKRATIPTTLMPWAVYEFRIQAVNALGVGKPSSPSPQFPTQADKPYQAPANVGGGGGKTGDLTITWTPLPPSLQNGPGIHYKIFWRLNGSGVEFQSLLLKEFGNIGMHVVHINGDKYYYTPYDVKVQAFNDQGAGPESDIMTIYSAEDMPRVAPQQVHSRAFNSTALNVTWNPVDQSRETLRGKLIGHRLKYWKKENKEEECIYYLSRTTRNWALIVGLQPDTTYLVKVMAFNSAGEGPESEHYLERTFRKAPQKPPASVKVWAVDPNTVRVVWRYVQPTDMEEPLIGYKVRVWEIDQDMSTANDTIVLVERNLEAYVHNLTPGKAYNLRVLAYSNGGDGRMSSPAITFQMGDYHGDAYGYYDRGAAHVHGITFKMILFIMVFLHSRNWLLS